MRLLPAVGFESIHDPLRTLLGLPPGLDIWWVFNGPSQGYSGRDEVGVQEWRRCYQ